MIVLTAGAAGALGLLLRAPVPAPSGPAGPAARAGRRSVAVLGFRDEAPRPDSAWVGTAVAEALSSGLGVGGELRVIPGDIVGRARVELNLPSSDELGAAALARVAANLGADLVVVGSYSLVPDSAVPGLVLRVRLQDVQTARTLAAVEERGSAASVAGIVGRAEAELRRVLGVEVAHEAPHALPADPEAARLYAEGLARLRVFDAAGARERLQQAADREPSHPLLHVALADAWRTLGHESRAKMEVRRAFDLSGALPLAARLEVEARHRELIGERDKAIEVWRTLWSFAPDNLEHGLRLAEAQTGAGQREAALETIAALRRLPPPAADDPRIAIEEARAANAAGDYRRGQAAAARAAEAGTARGARVLVARARLVEAYSFRALGQPASAVAAAEVSRRLHAAVGDHLGAAQAALEMAGVLRYQGRLEEARTLAEEALGVCREAGDELNTARALNRIASVQAELGRLERARDMYEESLALYRRVDDASGVGTALNNVGETMWRMGELAGARRRLDEAVVHFRRIGSRRGLCFALFNLGFVRQDQGEISAARRAHEESLEIARAIGERSLSSMALFGLGQVALAEGDLAESRLRHEEALAVRRELGEQGRVADSLLALAAIDVEEGRGPEARRRIAEAEALDHEGGRPASPLALALLAEAHLAEGRPAEARVALERHEPAAGDEEPLPVRHALALARARTEAAQGRAAEAARLAAVAQGDAERAGFEVGALEARLILGRVRPGGAASLEAVARDAASRGFGLLARKARPAPAAKARRPGSGGAR